MENCRCDLSGSIVRIDNESLSYDLKEIMSLNPPPIKEVKEEDIIVRKCYLTGDAINHYYGRFRTSDLNKLLKMVSGAPVLKGHDKTDLPLGRFFGGEIIKIEVNNIFGELEETSFIVPKFYVLKSQSQNIVSLIDAGIINEASISWWFEKATCCICEKDIRDLKCDHIPGKMYDSKLCYYFYDKIVDVAEGSLVYKGAHPGTRFAASFNGKNMLHIRKKEITFIYKGKKYLTKR